MPRMATTPRSIRISRCLTFPTSSRQSRMHGRFSTGPLGRSSLRISGPRLGFVSLDGGSRVVSSTSARTRLRSPADFAGLKIRALGPLAVPLIEALKASAVPIGFGDLYTALTTGLVDVQDNSLSIFRLVRLQEVHKFILLSGHSYAVGVLGINNAFYIQLSPDERAAVDAAALKAIAFNREGSRKAEQEAIAALTTTGVEFVDLTSEQKQEFRRITQGPVINWLKMQISVPGLIDEALSATQAAR